MVEFLRGNPALEAFEQTTDVYRQRAADDRRTSIEDEDRAQQQGLDRAIRSGLGSIYATEQPAPSPMMESGRRPSPVPQQSAMTGGADGGAPSGMRPSPSGGMRPQAPSYSDPVMGALLSSPGGADAAMRYHGSLQSAQAAERDRMDEMEKLAVQALARGDMVTYRYYASRSGLQLPPGVEQAAGAGRAATASTRMWGRALELAERYYKDDPQQATAFIQAYTQSNGDLGMAITTAGIPVSRPNLDLQTIMLDGQRVLAAIDEDTGRFSHWVTDDQGNPLQSGSQSGSAPNLERERRLLAQQYLDAMADDRNYRDVPLEQREAEAWEMADRRLGGGSGPAQSATVQPAPPPAPSGGAPSSTTTGAYLDERGQVQMGTPPSMTNSGAGAGSAAIPPAAADMLRQDPSPQARAEFDEVFGQGASASVVGN